MIIFDINNVKGEILQYVKWLVSELILFIMVNCINIIGLVRIVVFNLGNNLNV